MTNEQFQIFLDRNGSDPERWPVVDPRFSTAHAVIRSLFELDADLLGKIGAGPGSL